MCATHSWRRQQQKPSSSVILVVISASFQSEQKRKQQIVFNVAKYMDPVCLCYDERVAVQCHFFRKTIDRSRSTELLRPLSVANFFFSSQGFDYTRKERSAFHLPEERVKRAGSSSPPPPLCSQWEKQPPCHTHTQTQTNIPSGVASGKATGCRIAKPL